VIAWVSFAGLLVNALTSWLFVYVFEVLVLVQQHVLRLEVSVRGGKVQEKSTGSACVPFPEYITLGKYYFYYRCTCCALLYVVQQSRPITFYQWVYVVQIVTQRTEMYLQNFSLKRTNGVKWVNTVQHFA
jgi:hypothetical protein